MSGSWADVASEAADQRIGDGRAGGEAGGEGGGFGGQVLVVDHSGDHAPVERLLGRDALAEQHHLHRPGAAGEARQQPGRARVRDQADIDEGLQEIGRAGGDDDVGAKRDARRRRRRRRR